MITLIPSVLDPATVQSVQSDLTALSGADCPGHQARRQRSDDRAGPARQPNAAYRKLERRIVASLLANRRFVRAALPRRIVRMDFDRCEPGMGRHACVDEPLIAGGRTDLTFTLFLSDPADYDRGDLIVESNTGWESRKHAAGDLLLYPARYVHSVAPVTRGTRLAAVGWVESLTPSTERREILGDLDAALALLDDPCGRTDARLRIENARANLVRLWVNGSE